MKVFLKTNFVLLLIGTIFYGSAHKSWILLSYEINKLEIIEKFCVNKEETTFKCEGKCHLKTEFSKSENETNSQKSTTVEESKLLLFQLLFEKLTCDIPIKSSIVFITYDESLQKRSPNSIFHPPKV